MHRQIFGVQQIVAVASLPLQQNAHQRDCIVCRRVEFDAERAVAEESTSYGCVDRYFSPIGLRRRGIEANPFVQFIVHRRMMHFQIT